MQFKRVNFAKIKRSRNKKSAPNEFKVFDVWTFGGNIVYKDFANKIKKYYS